MAVITLHAFVSGRVQGVWFRQSTKEQAGSLGLNGWVRNLDDGRVEVMASGEEKAVRQLEAWLARGPELANVAEVQSEFSTLDETLDEFEVI
ncbi:acylphosphatase [Neptuniibacter sp.]|jgi:acylphosphatase|uniref:acylphosphatase n=1 Tax=Neptuniibacter sp. TaxID=1962643 RepID=UPI003B5A664C